MDRLTVVHFSLTRLADAPLRLVNLLRKHSEHEVVLIDRGRGSTGPHHLDFAAEREKAGEVAKRADIIHSHNHVDFGAQPFAPIDFQGLIRGGARFLRHYHSEPQLLSSRSGVPVREIVGCDLPAIVIAQFHERYYPKARLVPNVMPIEDPEYLPSDEDVATDVVFTPTASPGAWESRWNTKGRPETIAMLESVRSRTGCSVSVLQSRPLAEVLRVKSRSRVVIDDLVTGSYHLAGLEGLSMGKPVLSFLDSRVEFVLREISGSHECPFVNVRLEDAGAVLTDLIRNPVVAAEIGKASRAWMERYWSERTVVEHYLRVYEQLMHDPTTIRRQAGLEIDGTVKTYSSVTLPDLVYNSRAGQYKRSMELRERGRLAARVVATKVRGWTKRYAPDWLARILRRRRGAGL